jgi:Zn finger protein HypA/HybF involved in hydrogenase expression
MCDGAEFIMNVQKLKLHCNGCGAEFEIDEHRYQCLDCESLDVKVIDGEDMYLMSLEME